MNKEREKEKRLPVFTWERHKGKKKGKEKKKMVPLSSLDTMNYKLPQNNVILAVTVSKREIEI